MSQAWNYQWLAPAHLHIYCSKEEEEVVVVATIVVVEEGGWKLGQMIDVELASCIKNSPLLGRQRTGKSERKRGTMSQTENEWERMKSRIAYSWLKLKTLESVSTGDFLHPSFTLPLPFLSLYPILPSTSCPLSLYFVGRCPDPLKTGFNRSWLNQLKLKLENLLKKIQSDKFSLQLIGALRGVGCGDRATANRGVKVRLFLAPMLIPTHFNCTPPCFFL